MTLLMVHSAVSLEREPYVTILLGDHQIQLSPEDAQQHIREVSAALYNAFNDKALLDYLIDDMNLSDEMAAATLGDIREKRGFAD